MVRRSIQLVHQNILYIAFVIALFSMTGSLFFSEVLKFPPCILCWYQRIAMYPLVPILAIGILKKDKLLPYYVLPLSLVGLTIAFYHNLLYYNIIPEAAAPCALGISCTTKFIEWFGFITIPFLSFLGFAIISSSMYIYMRKMRES
jgi:disulfide bond formation protein DsbB